MNGRVVGRLAWAFFLMGGLAEARPGGARPPFLPPQPTSPEEAQRLRESPRTPPSAQEVQAYLRSKIPARGGAPAVHDPRAFRKSADVTGRVVSVADGELLFERSVEPRDVERLLALGFRRIRAEKEADHRTILGERMFAWYYVDPSAIESLRLDRFVGQEVILQLERDSAGVPMVLDIRRSGDRKTSR